MTVKNFFFLRGDSKELDDATSLTNSTCTAISKDITYCPLSHLWLVFKPNQNRRKRLQHLPLPFLDAHGYVLQLLTPQANSRTSAAPRRSDGRQKERFRGSRECTAPRGLLPDAEAAAESQSQ